MTPERERLVRAAKEAADAVWLAGDDNRDDEIECEVERQVRAALAAYDAAHPEEAK